MFWPEATMKNSLLWQLSFQFLMNIYDLCGVDGFVTVFGRQRTSTMTRKQTPPLQQSWNREGLIRPTSTLCLLLQHWSAVSTPLASFNNFETSMSPLLRGGRIYSWPGMPIHGLLRWSSMASYFIFGSMLTRKKSSEIVARSVKIQRPKRNDWNF